MRIFLLLLLLQVHHYPRAVHNCCGDWAIRLSPNTFLSIYSSKRFSPQDIESFRKVDSIRFHREFPLYYDYIELSGSSLAVRFPDSTSAIEFANEFVEERRIQDSAFYADIKQFNREAKERKRRTIFTQ